MAVGCEESGADEDGRPWREEGGERALEDWDEGEGSPVTKEGENDAGGGGRVDADVLAEDLAGERRGERVEMARDACVLRRIGDDGRSICSGSLDMCLMTSAMSCAVQV